MNNKEWKDKGYIPFGENDEFRLYDPNMDCLPEEFREIKYKTDIIRDL